MFDFIKKMTGTSKAQSVSRKRRRYSRGYSAVASRARYGDIRLSEGSANYELRNALRKLRASSRYLSRNSSIVKRYLNLLSVNVIGSTGFVFESKVRQRDGDLDTSLNDRVTGDFRRWMRRPSTCKKLSFVNLQKQAIKSLARDGEFIWELVVNPRYRDNLGINPIEADQLDETLNTKFLGNGNEIKMGVELDAANAVVAYHFLTSHPGDSDSLWLSETTNKRYRRVDAKNVIHVFVSDRAGQCRGEPWTATVINEIRMLDGYRESEVVSRRIKASAMGFFERDEETNSSVIEELADPDDEQDSFDDVLEMSMEPGKMRQLPPGYKFKSFDPGGAQSDFSDFETQIKKSISTGLNISVFSLGMETSGVSFSTGRSVLTEDRDYYKDVQQFLIDSAMSTVFERWLPMRMLQEESNIPPTRTDAILDSYVFRGRGWDWVDPAKDVSSNAQALETGQTSLSRIAAKRGTSVDELLDEIAEDKKKIEDRGLTVLLSNGNPKVNNSSESDKDDEE